MAAPAPTTLTSCTRTSATGACVPLAAAVAAAPRTTAQGAAGRASALRPPAGTAETEDAASAQSPPRTASTRITATAVSTAAPVWDLQPGAWEGTRPLLLLLLLQLLPVPSP